MNKASIAVLGAVLGLASACGDDGTGDETGASTGGDSGSTTQAPATDDGTTSGSSGEPGTSGGSTSTGTPDDSTGSTSEGETDTAGFDCDALAPGPLVVEEVFPPGAPFNGSEDIAFDGQGNVAGKSGGNVVLVAADGSMVDGWPDPGPAWGMRFTAAGELLAAKYQIGEIHVVNDGGAVLVNGLAAVNGLFPDFDGNLWFTDGGAVRRRNADGSIDPIVTGTDAMGSNGVVWDPDRGLLFYTRYGAAEVRSVVIGGDGSPGANSLVADIGGPGTAVDGLSMDACGNLYAVDQANAALYRVYMDETGSAVGDPELLVASFPSNVANAVFGTGDGWDPLSVYAAGVPGGVYRVEIGVPGAPYPTP
ncbi:MAG: gluconolactonase [Myxococcales bacterium]|nr:gluconolactonase [Myxococcales bacterium]